MSTLARIKIYSGRDIFTPPKTKVVWMGSPIPLPVLKKKYFRTKVVLIVSGPNDAEVKRQVNKCVKGAAIRGMVAGIVTGYATGGAGAVEAGVMTFAIRLDSCVEESLERKLKIEAEIDSSGSWEKKWR